MTTKPSYQNNQDNQYQTIIIGGGAAGLVAAISTARQSQHDVLIIEKNEAIGIKILVTGNGRCNLTNTNLSPNKYYGENTKCLHSIFNQFSFDDTMIFFEELGVELKTEQGGRVFPITDKASTVVEALINEISQLKVKVNLEERAIKLSPIKTGWEVKSNKDVYQAKTVVLATGGKSYPQLGTTGDGYDIARKLGHRIIETRPALVALELEGKWFRELQGIQVNVEITLKTSKKMITRRKGEMLFTHFGISGPSVLDLSHLIIDSLHKCHMGNITRIGLFPKPDFIVSINFLPEYQNVSDLTLFLKTQPKRTIINALSQLLPKKLCSVLLNELKIKADNQVSQITKQDILLITEQLSNWQLRVKRPRSFKESMVTAGGVSLDEVNPKTMQSLKAKGLYFAGEILDINGVSGGYNLQFAWSTGYIAGLQE